MAEAVDMSVVVPRFVEHGVWLRPFGKLLYTMPPYVISPRELSEVTAALRDVASGS
jgi:adenosylmethionine-8-amino-7-oxononanoate aminotransferase